MISSSSFDAQAVVETDATVDAELLVRSQPDEHPDGEEAPRSAVKTRAQPQASEDRLHRLIAELGSEGPFGDHGIALLISEEVREHLSKDAESLITWCGHGSLRSARRSEPPRCPRCCYKQAQHAPWVMAPDQPSSDRSAGFKVAGRLRSQISTRQGPHPRAVRQEGGVVGVVPVRRTPQPARWLR